MHSLTIFLLLLFTTTQADQLDTMPDPELQPYIPPYLLDDDDHTTTERPYTDMRYPFELPPMPPRYGPVHPIGHDVEYDEYEDEDWMVHTYVPVAYVPITTEDPHTETDAIDVDTEDDGFEEIGAEHGSLMDSTNENCISWRLIISTTFLLCIISTFL
ncbi:hypothetical protein JTE90_027215 [Oedothorax gibbosus]|uniref:Uncharacterized protein n=1 Tax=Oedothorax gibbosus TaxID=931172 RepID=A0AAV6U2T6_9ARAC|nr:hypothetical protein JTE90_027215 [Oedothorax gibbosus]